MSLYGVPNAYILGLSMDGPGRRTADPVPNEMTRYPALLQLGHKTYRKHKREGLTIVRNGLPSTDSTHDICYNWITLGSNMNAPDCLHRQRKTTASAYMPELLESLHCLTWGA